MASLRALRPFAHREFRVLISALSISIFGSGMWAVAMVYEVIHLGGGPLELSLVATAASIGLVGFVLAGGIAADRFPQRLLIIAVEGANLAVIATITALALFNVLQLWHLAVGAFVIGVGQAFFFPAYSAMLPRILPADDLLAANGLEGTVRPVLQQAAGPAIAGILVAVLSPAHAVAGVAVCHLLAFGIVNLLSRRPGGGGAAAASPGTSTTAKSSLFKDLQEGFSYTIRTPWLLWTLIWACLSVLFLIGPIEVLLPFVVRDQLGGDSRTFGFLLAVMGVGSAAAALATATFRLPRRYLTVMVVTWGLGSLPVAAIGFMDNFWVLGAAMLIFGATEGVGMVIWGTLLQRRVPRHLLGRISSLDFFVSLALMPVSMALAGPLAEVVPLWLIFFVAGLVCPIMAFVALFAARMMSDEIANPLTSSSTGSVSR
ncbi:MFS transporter [Paenarthrobacter aurescens]|uniref:Tetracycline efflux MFS transporter Tet(V) n=1 Tax=Paenarthrobacter aurescens TaxID=43663 RepID=A0A4Y3NGN1_PAEAU|nr:MFS transporter [Paenarthrobacter aurescens]MDO6142053.1 MFS transporter [Paenarthrobacter aurescens]MDO6145857.1 MFS transporter [Paenarthrobacter aurescens]MDO6157102.1 MFS transporter [Paenarthrobacter aurescens]MDO6161088.1 MFS transporter [Paenarthrobacter aurescens]GEB20980.1 tetracycline efflux MFS transporter Tet(V) [Paenarthrobacter aurescens]